MAAPNQTTQVYTLKNAKGEVISTVRANNQTEAYYIAGVSLHPAEVPPSKITVTTNHDNAIVHEKG